LKLLGAVCAALDASGFPYALIGAGAMTVHGVGRSTLDLDLLTTNLSVLGAGFWSERTAPGVFADVRRGDADDPLAGVVRFDAEGDAPVDLVVGRSAWQSRILERSGRLPLGELTIPVVGVADLILLKLFAGGSQDGWDVDQLLAAGDRSALAAQVEPRLRELPPEAAELWSRVLGAEKR
jgi:hypothetical protein